MAGQDELLPDNRFPRPSTGSLLIRKLPLHLRMSSGSMGSGADAQNFRKQPSRVHALGLCSSETEWPLRPEEESFVQRWLNDSLGSRAVTGPAVRIVAVCPLRGITYEHALSSRSITGSTHDN